MRGHVVRRGGTWSYVHDLERLPEGKRRQVWKGGFATRKAAEAALAASLVDLTKGVEPVRRRVTLAGYLLDEWLPSLHDLRPNTVLSYRTLARRHLIPHLGHLPLHKITRADCDRLVTTLSTPDDAGRALRPATIRRIHALLHACLNAAVRDGLVPVNVASHARLPRNPRRPRLTWSPQDLQRFLAHCGDDPLTPVYLLLATTGLRRGEALGLTWDDLDLDSSTLTVRRARISINYAVVVDEPKTHSSERTVALDAVTVAVLRDVQLRQQAQAALLRTPWARSCLVFTRADGGPWHPEYVSKHFTTVARAAEVPLIRLHDVRHTHASLALREGVHLKIMQERLGHSSISVTADLYSHVAPGLQKDVATRIADLALGLWKPPLANGLQDLETTDDADTPPQGKPQVGG